MKRVLIYRHPHCIKCARISRVHHAVDWFNRIADTTTTPPTGPLRMGEIVVKDLRTDRMLRGAEGVRLVYRQAPAYWLLLPLLWIPPLRAWIDREVRGCSDGSCQIEPDENNPRVDHA